MKQSRQQQQQFFTARYRRIMCARFLSLPLWKRVVFVWSGEFGGVVGGWWVDGGWEWMKVGRQGRQGGRGLGNKGK